ncbi:30S ribosomal protein S16 [Candidatus Peregrinibacteria bacterium CG_4_9_14_0_2_um_filter_41_14]|nr:MAG: 30S ribosomal protein S16 [Candidatus Peregrinibacteria bacterium CG_4_10_14_0_2_um_filter_41_8]PJC38179.1 MAG: 30S ribosomal protein S16 [Candidatus Peregrinibacteria bacterium CG_4_9_14_0_2_um_filter_41_14]
MRTLYYLAIFPVLRIRLQRTGRKNRAEYRVVIAEQHLAVKKAALEIVGHYLPTRTPKVIEIDLVKVKHWIDRGAQPTDTVASLCKQLGMDGMDKYMEPRTRKRKPTKEPVVAETAPAAEAPAEAMPEAEPTPEPEAAPEE